MKARARKVNPQQVVYELKHRMVIALNKVADRDTYQIGVEELEKTAESLNPDGIITFVSCVLDTDSEQKSAVRKECVRMMGLLAKLHGVLIAPHLGKMVASIVKRLKDQDSVVRDTCVETMGVLASEFGNNQVESDGIFVLLVRPLFEALGEQNKQIQSGASMCLARVIDNMSDPPVSILQKMLARTMKLLKNPHFMAKPAVIELNRSLIQAGGALSENALSTAISSIQEALKDTDWTTRKSASLALGDIGSSGGSFLAPFKASCIRALESCRFDKVKPVRDAVLQAISCWKSIQEHDVPELSASMSSIKDTLYQDDSSDIVSGGSTIWKDVAHKESGTNLLKKRAPLSDKQGSQTCTDKCNKLDNNDWHIEIAVPKTCNVTRQYLQSEESEGNSVTKTLETVTTDIMRMRDIGHEYDIVDEKQEYSSSFNAVSHSHSHRGDIKKMKGADLFTMEGRGDIQSYPSKLRDRTSLDSTITDPEETHLVNDSCSQNDYEINSIRKQLMEIQKNQSSLMDLLEAFTTSTLESLSVIQSKVSSLEHAVDKITKDGHKGRYNNDLANNKCVDKCPSIPSLTSTTYTPRPSIDSQDRKSSVHHPSRNREFWEGKEVEISNSNNSRRPCLDSWRSPLSMMNRNCAGDEIEQNSRQEFQDMSYHRTRKSGRAFASDMDANSRKNSIVSDNEVLKHIKGFLCDGDLDGAYREALNFGNQLTLIKLIDGTGPVLDNLSNRTISDLFTALASCVLEHTILESVIPWLQQIVDLSAVHGPNCIPLPLKVRKEIISAVQEALDAEVTHPSKRRLVAQVAMKLQQIWGRCP